jgi:hypothetical protein
MLMELLCFQMVLAMCLLHFQHFLGHHHLLRHLLLQLDEMVFGTDYSYRHTHHPHHRHLT